MNGEDILPCIIGYTTNYYIKLIEFQGLINNTTFIQYGKRRV